MTTMRRVLHVGKFYPPHPGGMERVVETLCQATRGLVENHVLVTNASRATIQEVRDGVQVTRVGTIGAAGSVHVAPAFASWLRRIPADLMTSYQTAVQYHFWHALGLLLVGVLLAQKPDNGALGIAAWLLVGGIVLFSGSLYVLALTGLRMFGALTPVGGVLFLAAWLAVAWGAWRSAS